MTWTLGVDFGTSNTAAAYRVDGGPAQAVRLSDQAEQMPSAVLALDSGVMVGGAAVRSARLDPQRFEPSPKRRIGEGDILLGPREWAVTQLIAEVLGHVKQKAMWVAGGQPPAQLVLTYPQQWARGRTDLLRQAAARAGFDPATVAMVTEPIAAATWYASTQPVPAGKCVAVFDFGGGTCDVAVLRSNPDVPGTFTVLAADGIDPLGGELLDLRLLEWTLEQLSAGGNRALVTALSAPENLGAMLTLKEQVRHAKHELAEYESAAIPVAVGQIQTVVTVTSAEFDKVVGGEIDEAVALTRRALVASGVAPTDLHALYLTGGSSHLRLVHRRMTELLGRPPATFNDPKLVVAQGALLVPQSALEYPGQAPAATPAPAPMPALVPGPTQNPAPNTGPIGGSGFGPGRVQPSMPTQPMPRPADPMPLPGGTGPLGQYGGYNPSGPLQQPPTRAEAPRGYSGGPGSMPPVSGAPMPQPPGQQPGPAQIPQAPPPTMRMPSAPGPVQGGYGPPPGPPSGPMSGPSQLPGQPGSGGDGQSKGRPTWLIPALAAALVAIIASVVVIIVKNSGSAETVTDGPQTSVVQTTPSVVETTSETLTEPTTVESTGVDCVVNPSDPACEPQYQRCPDGTTVAPDQACPTLSTVTCWDGAEVTEGDPCTQLTGQAALEWVFPIPDNWTRTCSEYTEGKYEGELEVYQCKVEQLPSTLIYLSRWDSAESAKTKFTSLFQEPTDFRLENDGTEPAAYGWSGQEDSSTGDGSKVDARVVAYRTAPFSMLCYFADPTGAGLDSQMTWDTDQLYQPPDTITALGSIPS